MPILIAAIVVVGGLCLVDLLLTLGVIRRLRVHTDMLAGARAGRPPVTGLETGQLPGAFSAVTTAGDLVSNMTGLRVVAFFSSSCPACPAMVPPFAEYVTSHHVGQDGVLAVVAGSPDAPPPYLAKLAEAAQVHIESAGGDVIRAFDVLAFPAFCLLDVDGAVVASAHDPSALPVPVPA
jgi:thiol-disulfide isomerase/thioredoxin